MSNVQVGAVQHIWHAYHNTNIHPRLGSIATQSRSSLDQSHFVARSLSQLTIFGCRVYKRYFLLILTTLWMCRRAIETVSVSVSPKKNGVSGTALHPSNRLSDRQLHTHPISSFALHLLLHSFGILAFFARRSLFSPFFAQCSFQPRGAPRWPPPPSSPAPGRN